MRQVTQLKVNACMHADFFSEKMLNQKKLYYNVGKSLLTVRLGKTLAHYILVLFGQATVGKNQFSEDSWNGFQLLATLNRIRGGT